MIEMIIFSIIGLLLLVFAILIGIFGKIELLHSYHYTNVSENDTKAYTRSMGGVLSLFALSCFASAAVRALLTASVGWVAVLLAGFAVSTVLLWYVQKKYNGGIFG